MSESEQDIPQPRIALALSGGGYRATLFHLGVVACMRASGSIRNVRLIASVSGGSVIAAHMALNWEVYAYGTDAQFNAAASKLVHLAQSDTRGYVLRRIPLSVLTAVVPRARLTRTRLLGRRFGALYGTKTSLQALKTSQRAPDLHLLTTNLTTGDLAVFTSEGMINCVDGAAYPCANLPLGLAVAASAASPAFFPPLAIRHDTVNTKVGDFQPATQFLTDGGVYDNLGVRHLRRILENATTEINRPTCVIVSNAGGDFDWTAKRLSGLISTALRASDILMKRIGDLEYEAARQTVLSNVGVRDVIFLGIRDSANDMRTARKDPSALHADLSARLPLIRTDFNAFSQMEIRALCVHGFTVCRNAIIDKPELCQDSRVLTQSSPYDPFPSHSESLQDARSLSHFKKSSRRSWGLLSYKDPAGSILFGISALLVVGVFVLMAAFAAVQIAERSWGQYVLSWVRIPIPVRETNIKQFMDQGGLGKALSAAQHSVYLVNMTDRTLRSTHFETLADVVNRNVELVNCLYVPREYSPVSVASYIELQKKYHTLSGDLTAGLKQMWSDQHVELQNIGMLTGPPLNSEFYELRFYSEHPEGWLIVTDFDKELLTARDVFWFPYVVASDHMNRPGFRLLSGHQQRSVLLKWLAGMLNDSSRSRVPDSTEIKLWADGIISALNG